MNCNACGSELRQGASFCSRCGTTVGAEGRTPAASQQAQRSVQPSSTHGSGGSGKLLIAGIALVAVLALGGGAYYFLNSLGSGGDSAASSSQGTSAPSQPSGGVFSLGADPRPVHPTQLYEAMVALMAVGLVLCSSGDVRPMGPLSWPAPAGTAPFGW